jgi:hypothetical protein
MGVGTRKETQDGDGLERTGTRARTSNISIIATQEGWQGTGNVLLGMVCRMVNSADAVSGTSAILNVHIFVKKSGLTSCNTSQQ